MLDHTCVTLCNLLVVFEVDKLLECPQIHVQLSLDPCVRCGKVKLISVIKLSEGEVLIHLVDCLLHKRGALLAHCVKEEEF